MTHDSALSTTATPEAARQQASLVKEVFTSIWARHGGPGVLADADGGNWPGGLWGQLADADLPWVSVPEEAGGPGGDLADGCALWRAAGGAGCPLPIGETALAGWLLHSAGLKAPRAALTVVPGPGTLRVDQTAGGPTLSGRARQVPWAGDVDYVVALVPAGDGQSVVSVPRSALTIRRLRNLAGEPRDEVTAAAIPLQDGQVAKAPPWLGPDEFQQRGALLRVQQMAGAMDAAVARTIAYSSERSQFGRPIGRFQAVAHLIVQATAEAAAAAAAADLAATALSRRATADEVACAKVIAGEAATVVAANCHQAQGAIGMTQEYPLHYWTRRLWSWREEFGTTAHWSRYVGAAVVGRGPAGLWPAIAAASMRST